MRWTESAVQWSAEAHGFKLHVYDRGLDRCYFWRVIDPNDSEPLSANGVHNGEAETREGAQQVAEAYALAASVRRDNRDTSNNEEES